MKVDLPPLTDEQRARMVEDFTAAGVERMAADMASRDQLHPLDAVNRAREYRKGHHDGTPGAAFWSRVIVRLLCLPTPECPPVVFADAATAPPVMDIPDKPSVRVPVSTAYSHPGTPKHKKPGRSGQGSLF